MNTSRRTFLSTATAAAFAPHIFGQQKSGKKYRTALIGSGWWGTNILREAAAAGESEIVAVCDVDPAARLSTIAQVTEWNGDKPKEYEDFREMLETEKPEIVIVGSPDHWHPLHLVHAVRAGAHVYCEKPIGHHISDGQAMVKAVKETGKTVQVGLHRRLSPHNIAAMDFLKSGKVGEIGTVRCIIHYPGGPEEAKPNTEPPKGMNWDLWCGPAPLRPFNEKIHPRGFRGFLDYANGTIADWGVHWFDQVLWWTEEKAPGTVFSSGGRDIKGPVVNDGTSQTTDAPGHQEAIFDFESFTCHWDSRNFGGNPDTEHNVGCYFHGTKGILHLGWLDGFTFYPIGKGGKQVHMDPVLHQPDSQNIKESWADFLDAVKTGRKPVCDIETAHRSANMSLLAMMSYKLGRSIKWDGENETCPGDEEANALLTRKYRGDWEL